MFNSKGFKTRNAQQRQSQHVTIDWSPVVLAVLVLVAVFTFIATHGGQACLNFCF